MPETAICSEIHEPLDVHGHQCPQFAFNLVLAVDGFSDAVDLGFRQHIGFCTGIDVQLGEYFLGCRSTDTVDIGQTDLNPLALG